MSLVIFSNQTLEYQKRIVCIFKCEPHGEMPEYNIVCSLKKNDLSNIDKLPPNAPAELLCTDLTRIICPFHLIATYLYPANLDIKPVSIKRQIYFKCETTFFHEAAVIEGYHSTQSMYIIELAPALLNLSPVLSTFGVNNLERIMSYNTYLADFIIKHLSTFCSAPLLLIQGLYDLQNTNNKKIHDWYYDPLNNKFIFNGLDITSLFEHLILTPNYQITINLHTIYNRLFSYNVPLDLNQMPSNFHGWLSAYFAPHNLNILQKLYNKHNFPMPKIWGRIFKNEYTLKVTLLNFPHKRASQLLHFFGPTKTKELLKTSHWYAFLAQPELEYTSYYDRCLKYQTQDVCHCIDANLSPYFKLHWISYLYLNNDILSKAAIENVATFDWTKWNIKTMLSNNNCDTFPPPDYGLECWRNIIQYTHCLIDTSNTPLTALASFEINSTFIWIELAIKFVGLHLNHDLLTRMLYISIDTKPPYKLNAVFELLHCIFALDLDKITQYPIFGNVFINDHLQWLGISMWIELTCDSDCYNAVALDSEPHSPMNYYLPSSVSIKYPEKIPDDWKLFLRQLEKRMIDTQQ